MRETFTKAKGMAKVFIRLLLVIECMKGAGEKAKNTEKGL